MPKKASKGTSPLQQVASCESSSLDELDRHLYRAGYIKSVYAGIDLADDDDAGVGNILTVMAIVDGQVRAGRPVDQLPNLVRVRPLSFCRDRPRQMRKFFSPEQIVHPQSERQQRNEIPCRIAVDQRGDHHFIFDLEAYLHRVGLRSKSFCWERGAGTAVRTVGVVVERSRQYERPTTESPHHAFFPSRESYEPIH